MNKPKEKTLITLNKTTFVELNELTCFNQKLYIAKMITLSLSDRKIMAIKIFRNIFGVDLEEAKDFINAFSITRWVEDQHGVNANSLVSGETTLALLEELKLKYDTYQYSDCDASDTLF